MAETFEEITDFTAAHTDGVPSDARMSVADYIKQMARGDRARSIAHALVNSAEMGSLDAAKVVLSYLDGTPNKAKVTKDNEDRDIDEIIELAKAYKMSEDALKDLENLAS